jgi:hypothetical protein
MADGVLNTGRNWKEVDRIPTDRVNKEEQDGLKDQQSDQSSS